MKNMSPGVRRSARLLSSSPLVSKQHEREEGDEDRELMEKDGDVAISSKKNKQNSSSILSKSKKGKNTKKGRPDQQKEEEKEKDDVIIEVDLRDSLQEKEKENGRGNKTFPTTPLSKKSSSSSATSSPMLKETTPRTPSFSSFSSSCSGLHSSPSLLPPISTPSSSSTTLRASFYSASPSLRSSSLRSSSLFLKKEKEEEEEASQEAEEEEEDIFNVSFSTPRKVSSPRTPSTRTRGASASSLSSWSSLEASYSIVISDDEAETQETQEVEEAEEMITISTPTVAAKMARTRRSSSSSSSFSSSSLKKEKEATLRRRATSSSALILPPILPAASSISSTSSPSPRITRQSSSASMQKRLGRSVSSPTLISSSKGAKSRKGKEKMEEENPFGFTSASSSDSDSDSEYEDLTASTGSAMAFLEDDEDEDLEAEEEEEVAPIPRKRIKRSDFSSSTSRSLKGKEPDEDEDENEANGEAEEDEEEVSKAKQRKRKRPLPNVENPEHDEGDISPYLWESYSTPQPASIKIKMLPFQLESLTWMTQQENNERWRGGILADDMGMGKTLQAIACVIHNTPDPKVEKIATTLVICPVVALAQWEAEIKKYTVENTLKVYTYHSLGKEDIVKPEDLTDHFDVVLSTYSIVEADFRRQTSGYRRKDKKTGEMVVVKKPSLLHATQWYRIILDEAHSIKDRSCSTARACFNLQAKKRWSLTGTPLQNRVGELYSLIRFMQITPWSFYYCKKCDCKCLFWKFDGRGRGSGCESCGHTAMSHFSWWNRHVLNPIIKHGMTGPGSHAMKVLKSILQRVMLRRTKQEKAADLCLPPRMIKMKKPELDDEENDFYDALYTQSQVKFMGFVEAGTVLNNYANVFDLLLRLRQTLDHPYLVLHRQQGSNQTNNEICQICYDPAEEAVTSRCKHVFCRVCIETFLQSQGGGLESSSSSSSISSTVKSKSSCPVCYRPLTIDLLSASKSTGEEDEKKTKPTKVTGSILQRIDLSNWRSSTKIEALMEELTEMSKTDPNAKALVFTQFVNFLDLIEWRLKLGGFGCVKLDGRMSAIQKAAAIQKFNTNPDINVFLISLKAGGVALNLTIANYCFLMDPWWNPAVEFQAIDRIHRLGQYKCVNVKRFVIPNTIEERILQLQEKKHLLFQSTVGMDADALSRLSVDDLKFLFGK